MIWQNDTAFFQIQVLGGKGELARGNQGNLILPQDVLGMTMTEEFHQQPTGTISLRDPDNVYSRILRNGAAVNISFGYKSPSQRLDFRDPGYDVAQSGLQRRGIQAFITGPSGGGSEGGKISFNANFLSFGTRNPKQDVVYEKGTKQDCVQQVMDRIGIVAPEINFERGNDKIDTTCPERQYESDFRTLARWAGEWKAIFRVGFVPNGKLTAVFIDPYKLPFSPNIALMSQVNRNAIDLWYRAGKNPNVRSFSWQRQDGNSGQGDGQIIYIVNGQVRFQSYHLPDETVTAWRLNPARIEKKLQDAGDKGGPQAQSDFLNSITSAESFNNPKIKELFDPINAKTAPNGLGYTMTGNMIGTPFLTPGMTAIFNGAFPDCFTKPDSGNSIFYYFQKVTHSFSLAGYFTDFEIVDTYSQTPIGANLQAAGG